MRSKAIRTPAVVITLGTTSSIAANELCYHLLGLEQDDRDAVAIVMIDTDISRPRFQDFLDQHSGAFHIYKAQIAVPAGATYTDELPRAIANHTFIPTKLPQYFDYGAGGIRNNGHVALCYDRDKVEKELRAALASVSQLTGRENEVRSLGAQVYVVSFLGGGTGSGIVSDIAVMIRQMLIGEQRQQRLVLFGILPGDSMPGVNANTESWRKSNATAALLEIMAHGQATQIISGVSGPYEKYLLAHSYFVPDAPIFNEIYLLGRTNLNSVEENARIVGLDLFQRITDASGVGDIERSEAPDRTVLAGSDDQYLPTNFSASCPYEVRFPIEEARRAFAEIAASYMLGLPEFIGQRPPSLPISDAQRNEWVNKWRGIAAVVQGTPAPNDLTISQPRQYQASEFEDAPPRQRDYLWQQLQRSLGDTNQQIVQVVNRAGDREEARIRTIPEAQQLGLNIPLGMQGRKILHYERLLAEYQEARDRLRAGRELTQGVPGRPVELEHGLDHSLLPTFLEDKIPGIFKRDIPAAVAEAYNTTQRANYQHTRATQLAQLFDRLIAEVASLLQAEGDWLAGARASERAAELRERGYARAAWLGKLERPHQHQRHLFDLGKFTDKAKAQGLAFIPAMEGVFRAATIGILNMDIAIADVIPPGEATTANENLALGDCTHRDTFDVANALRSKVAECIAFVNAARRDADGAATEQDLAQERAAQVPQKVVEYFEMMYNAWLKRKNLFDLLELGIAAEENIAVSAAQRKSQPYLERHIVNLKGVLGELVTYEPGLWLAGSSALLPTLYLGMNWRDSAGQRPILESALNAAVPLTQRVPQARVIVESDPHRLQVNYAQHGISIRTIPDFFSSANSAMAEYLRHQYAWYGDGQPGSYGMNKAPVHSSGEMERLVFGRDVSGNTSVVLRVIRPQFQRANEPGWAPPPGMPRGPAGGFQPQSGPQSGPQGGYFPPGGAARQNTPPPNTQNAPNSPNWAQPGPQGGYGPNGSDL